MDISFCFRKPGNTSSPNALSPPTSVDPHYLMSDRASLNKMINSAASPKPAPILNPSVSKYMSLLYFKLFSDCLMPLNKIWIPYYGLTITCLLLPHLLYPLLSVRSFSSSSKSNFQDLFACSSLNLELFSNLLMVILSRPSGLNLNISPVRPNLTPLGKS